MLQTIEGVLNPDGKIHLLETLKLMSPQKVLVTVLSEQTALQNTSVDFKTALFSRSQTQFGNAFHNAPRCFLAR